MLGNSRKLNSQFLALAAVFAIIMTVTSCAGRGEKGSTPGSSSAKKSPAHSASPTPSTPAEVSGAVRNALRRLGTGTATITGDSAGQDVAREFTVSCDVPETRMKFTARVPGRAGQAATVDYPIITSGSTYYVRQPKAVRSDPGKPWKKNRLTGMTTEIDTTFQQSTMDLYVANCDQPVALARAAKDAGDARTMKGTLKVSAAAKYATGYAERFYRYVRTLGVSKLEYTLELDAGFQPAKYRLTSSGANAEAVSWSVRFSGWHAPQIKVPPKNQIQ